MFNQPPWEHVKLWGDAKADLFDLLTRAVEVRDGVLADLSNPFDNSMGQGFIFYIRWCASIRELSKTAPHIKVVHFQRGVFSIHGVPIRLYRAFAEDEPPERVLEVSPQELDAWQRAFPMEQICLPWGTPAPAACDVLRIRTVPDEENGIAEFVFEELTSSGTTNWSWSIRAQEVPVALVDVATDIRQPVEQPPPVVGLRLLNTAAADSDDEE